MVTALFKKVRGVCVVGFAAFSLIACGAAPEGSPEALGTQSSEVTSAPDTSEAGSGDTVAAQSSTAAAGDLWTCGSNPTGGVTCVCPTGGKITNFHCALTLPDGCRMTGCGSAGCTCTR